MRILVLGAGAWGTALAINACGAGNGPRQVTLWARDPVQCAALLANRCNVRYLPDAVFPPGLQLIGGELSGLTAVLADQDLIVLAVPMAGLREMLAQLGGVHAPIVWLCKGFESPTPQANGVVSVGGLLGHEVQAAVAPNVHSGVLSGPSFAQEVAAGKPAALVAASVHVGVRDAMVNAFHSPNLRVYANDDVVGVEVGGAVKNVLAIATGLCDGLQLGLNARAALITRGLIEMTRLGVALGARPETFMGLSGLGDLVLTATGDLSRNRRVGLALSQGKTLADAVAELGHVAEGVYCARNVVQRAQRLGVDMPIAQCVVDLLDGRLQGAQAVSALMGREPGSELPGARSPRY
jgi:glycerol-3-phosphate dehydrogenase (NAD(P)+)